MAIAKAVLSISAPKFVALRALLPTWHCQSCHDCVGIVASANIYDPTVPAIGTNTRRCGDGGSLPGSGS